MEKNRLLIFSIGYLPGQGYGGPVSSLWRMTELIGDDSQICIVTRDRDLCCDERLMGIHKGWNRVGKAKVIYLSENRWRRRIFDGIIKKFGPDCIYISSFFAAHMTIPALAAASQNHIPVLLSPRGEFLAGALAQKTLKKKVYIFFLKAIGMLKHTFFHATSDVDARSIQNVLRLSADRLYCVSNIPPMISHKKQVNKTQGTIRILMASRIVRNKGVLVGIQAVNHMKGKVQLDIYGNPEAPEYYNECLEEVKKAPDNVCVRIRSGYHPNEIDTIFLEYDCCLCPTEFESYGQMIAEALTHDCPLVLSKGTTRWDDIQECGAGYTVPVSDVQGFTEALEKICKMSSEEYSQIVKNVRAYAEKMEDRDYLKKQYLKMIEMVSAQRR